MAMRVFRGFQNISTCGIVFGNPLEKNFKSALPAPDFQIFSTFSIVFGNLLEKQREPVLFAKRFTYSLTYFPF